MHCKPVFEMLYRFALVCTITTRTIISQQMQYEFMTFTPFMHSPRLAFENGKIDTINCFVVHMDNEVEAKQIIFRVDIIGKEKNTRNCYRRFELLLFFSYLHSIQVE